MPSVEANVIASLLVDEIISRHYAPRVLLCDRGITFLSYVVHFVKIFQIQKVNTSSYHPKTDLILTYVTLWRCLFLKDWDEFITPILFAHRTSVSEAIGDSPF